MTKDETIEKLFEQSNHGAQREDIEAAYSAGATAERMKWKSLCDQLGKTLESVRYRSIHDEPVDTALAAWRAMKCS